MSGQGLNSISRLSLLPWPYHDDSLNIFEQNGLETRGFWAFIHLFLKSVWWIPQALYNDFIAVFRRGFC